MSAHTPGPWQRSGVRQKLGNEDCIRVGSDGFAIAFLPIGARPQEQAGAIADARLISAAPELLEAVKLARATLADCGQQDSDNWPTFQVVVAAIAKATDAGGEPSPPPLGSDDPNRSKGAAQAPTAEPVKAIIRAQEPLPSKWISDFWGLMFRWRNAKLDDSANPLVVKIEDHLRALASRTDGAAEAERHLHEKIEALQEKVRQYQQAEISAHPTSRSVQKPAAVDGDAS